MERAMPPRLATQAAMIRVTLGLFTSGTRRMGDVFGARRRTESVSGRSKRRCFRINSGGYVILPGTAHKEGPISCNQIALSQSYTLLVPQSLIHQANLLLGVHRPVPRRG